MNKSGRRHNGCESYFLGLAPEKGERLSRKRSARVLTDRIEPKVVQQRRMQVSLDIRETSVEQVHFVWQDRPMPRSKACPKLMPFPKPRIGDLVTPYVQVIAARDICFKC